MRTVIEVPACRAPANVVRTRWKGCCFLQIPVERVENLLLWRDPYASAKVFGAGLYILICLRHLVCGKTQRVKLVEQSQRLACFSADVSSD